MHAHHYSLYGLVSAPRPTEARGQRLRELANDVCWERVPDIATKQRIGPLIYWHLREHDIPYPNHIRRTLAAIFARQKAIAAAQTETLAEIIAALRDAAIDSLVLKGGALAHILYPEPGLRPMEDLDILVPSNQGEAAREVLCDLGFHAPAPITRYARLQHHLPVAQRMTGNILVSVEVHTTAFNLLMAHELSFSSLQRPLVDYVAGGEAMQALAPEQMLWMQYHGLRKLAEPVRFLQLADLVGLVERYADVLDWPQLRRDYPDLWHALTALHAFTPLGGNACGHLGLDAERPPSMRGIGEDYRGWPRHGFTQKLNPRERWQLLAETLHPPEWWARFVYGIPSARGLSGVFFHRHPAAFIHQGLRRLYLGPVSRGAFFKTEI
ncbi:nucleotidyltransferase family protein [uncultured Thiocystis sp.]|jgi:hypothetical protein|uniref:nucleotidyltransferase family protein n=1 Tax=uncultured Thiocystis sp. TaxID=1202134 RepID=UPI0025EDCF74|nr:nucleotidyltransferase family protein [uncultured Thiocystis sp.]